MPLQREQLFKEALFRIIGIPSAEMPCFRPVGGGSINRAYQVSTKDNNHWFCKFNGTRKFPRTPGFWSLPKMASWAAPPGTSSIAFISVSPTSSPRVSSPSPRRPLVANLYPLLIDLNLFGTSYLSNILNTIQRF